MKHRQAFSGRATVIEAELISYATSHSEEDAHGRQIMAATAAVAKQIQSHPPATDVRAEVFGDADGFGYVLEVKGLPTPKARPDSERGL